MRQAAAAAAAASPAIHTSGLTKVYSARTVLSGLTMTVERGEVMGFLGPNGAGKTTAVKCLLGLVAPTSGEAWVLGRHPGDKNARRRIGYLPELFRYQSWLTAREVLQVHCELACIEVGRRHAEIRRALEIVDLAGRADSRVAEFSKGMQQRLGLAVALLGEPELVLLDEPTSALDPVGRHDVREIIRGLREQGTAVFLNSHLLTEVEMVCDRVVMIDRGQVIASGSLDQLLGGDTCRIRVNGLSPAQRLEAAGAARLEDDGEWMTLRGLAPEEVPELVARLVALGGRVYAVEPRRQTLEERFLEELAAE